MTDLPALLKEAEKSLQPGMTIRVRMGWRAYFNQCALYWDELVQYDFYELGVINWIDGYPMDLDDRLDPDGFLIEGVKA